MTQTNQILTPTHRQNPEHLPGQAPHCTVVLGLSGKFPDSPRQILGLSQANSWALAGQIPGFSQANSWAATGKFLGSRRANSRILPGKLLGCHRQIPGLSQGISRILPGKFSGCLWQNLNRDLYAAMNQVWRVHVHLCRQTVGCILLTYVHKC